MTIARKPPSEVRIDSSLVRALLREQHPDLTSLDLVDIGEGWDNGVFRLGPDLAVRLPRRAAAARLIEHEQRWLPQLATRLPVPVPVPIRVGRSGCGFPWPWSVVPWLPGQSALVAPSDLGSIAVSLGEFLRALHQPAPQDAPQNPWRGIPLACRNEILHKQLEQLHGLVNRDAVLDVWNCALATPPWSGPSLWIHGDVHPGNLLVAGESLSAVIDFGDLTAGDPATDLSVMWMLLPKTERSAFLTAARGPFSPCDEQTLMRARGWALALGLSWLASSRDDEMMSGIARRAIDAALDAGS